MLSLQFIYQDYLECLGKRRFILRNSKEETYLPIFQVTLNSKYQIVEFDSKNMNLVEQDIIINKILKMEQNQQIGPIPKVLIGMRKDI